MLDLCQETTKSPVGAEIVTNLWIQALIYFSNLPLQDCQTITQNALDFIVTFESDNKQSKEVISPLVVLDILKSKPDLKFKVLKNYLDKSI